MTLLDLEIKYCENLYNQQNQLINLYKEIKTNTSISLEKSEITKAILFRMKAYYDNQDLIKSFLNKGIASAASDFFVESVAFYLKLVLDIKKTMLEVYSERTIGSIRPDISVWKNNEPVAIIECKTQLGYNRNSWEEDFLNRESLLKRNFPVAKAYLLVMTSQNWPGFTKSSKEVGKKYFTLSSVWPREISKDNSDDIIVNDVEGLFEMIA